MLACPKWRLGSDLQAPPLPTLVWRGGGGSQPHRGKQECEGTGAWTASFS